MSAEVTEKKTLTVKLVKSVAGTKQSHRDTVRDRKSTRLNSSHQ